MFTYVLIGLGILVVVVVGIVLVVASMQPDHFEIKRSLSIPAVPDRIFPWIDDLHRWETWSPWEKLDPKMKRTYSGASSGKGAVTEWSGSGQVGAGRMEITGTTPPNQVTIQLDFLRPFKASNVANFIIEGHGSESRVIWTMSGANSFMSKVMCVFMSMDKMVGKDFEKGLTNLKSAVAGGTT